MDYEGSVADIADTSAEELRIARDRIRVPGIDPCSDYQLMTVRKKTAATISVILLVRPD